MTEWKVPLFDLDLGEEEYERVRSVLDSNWLTMGPMTKDFEHAFAEYLGVKHALAVSSGTAAMHLAHDALGLEQGDEILCPSLTFVATANAVLYTGATVVFADIASLDDPTVSPDDIESRITERTRGIVVVHYAGFPCRMDRIIEIARDRDLFVIEDAAHAVGAEYISSRLKAPSSKSNDGQRSTVNDQGSTINGKIFKLGTIGDIGCFSFFGNKNMTTAEGGMVVTNRDDLAEKIRIARSHGMTSLTWDRHKGHDYTYDVVGPGFNYRIDELRSSLGIVQLNKLERNNRKRRSFWTLYQDMLDGMKEIRLPFAEFEGISSCHICPILLSENVNRDALMGYLRRQGVQTSIHYPPIHQFSYYKRRLPHSTRLPLTESVGRKEVTLPLFPTMEERDVVYVVDAVKSFLSG
ncbi:MAG: DegT/DnrJ/EryC1/StrS aminotransferase family protein [Thermodesulfobacteriota bacterium]|nr:DegT/DnrJ/EryC1/StrS aminotransferase family protein [Thermodesulfobacteriota bacterium]